MSATGIRRASTVVRECPVISLHDAYSSFMALLPCGDGKPDHGVSEAVPHASVILRFLRYRNDSVAGRVRHILCGYTINECRYRSFESRRRSPCPQGSPQYMQGKDSNNGTADGRGDRR